MAPINFESSEFDSDCNMPLILVPKRCGFIKIYVGRPGFQPNINFAGHNYRRQSILKN